MISIIVFVLPRPPKEGKIMAQNPKKAIILHTFGVQVVIVVTKSLVMTTALKKQRLWQPKGNDMAGCLEKPEVSEVSGWQVLQLTIGAFVFKVGFWAYHTMIL